ncbi:MAG: hypothetical protein B6A08_00175 [Sorangiineae bacterium NIC37A_2]|jgi:DNA-binding transcriptional regulator YiaG|nr:MAG: hypothetical protein B6A08_00175 [Sorangiineae bacterium NIC37A_2]
MTCHECGGETFERRTVEIPVQVGPYRVVDRSVVLPVCKACGDAVIPAETHEQVELRAALVALTDAPTMTGPTLRFARKALGLTQTELAGKLATTGESISRWEREERLTNETMLRQAVRALLMERLMPPTKDVELRKVG